ncbi:unnamed protein product [Cylindrotheca closterium]|uniref:Protein kinase domain-containing protein n=1 Tax=Cylindrotheca closterium TaxID=2856 RepID=A0AAD2G4J6_9STRA|nr:unnamed protein product [Cylindrotheca closterium]
MKASSLYTIGTSCIFLFLALVLPSKKAITWGFQATTRTGINTQRQSKPISGSALRRSRNQYPYPYRPLWYSPSSDDDRNQDSEKVKSGNQNKSNKSAVKNSKSSQNGQTPFNIFNQIFQHLGYQSKVDEIEKKDVESESQSELELESSPASSGKQQDRVARNAIIMPKQGSATEKVKPNSKIQKPNIKATMVSQKNSNKSLRQERVSSLTTTNAGNVTANNTAFPTHEFQQKLLEASLAQRQKDMKENTTLSTKYQASMKHIRVLAGLYNSTKVDATLPIPEPTNFKKRGRRERESAKKLVRKATAEMGKIVSKEDAAKRKKKAVKAANFTATTREQTKETKDVQLKKQQPQNGKRNNFNSTRPLPPRQNQDSTRRMRRLSQFQQRLLQARLRSEAKFKVSLAQRHEAIIREQRLQSQRQHSDFRRRLLEQTNTYDIEAIKRKRRLQSQRKHHNFHRRLLEQKNAYDIKAIKRKQKLQSQRRHHNFHRRLLEQKNAYDVEAVKGKERRRIVEERLTQERRGREAKKKQEFQFHQHLLAAKYQYIERAQKFKMKRLLQEILQQKENKRKEKEYKFQKRRLEASFQSMENQKEKEKQQKEKEIQQKEKEKLQKLNSMLQNFSLMNYTKKKIGEKSKFNFQRKLLEASIENTRITRRREKKNQSEKQKLKLQQGLLEQRLRSEAKADDSKRMAMAQAEFQQNLVELYDKMASFSKYEKDFAADEMIRQKQKTDFQQDLLSARIRNDLVARKRLAEKRINELHQSLLDAQRESELAAAQVLEAEERKHQAQLDLEERQKREDEEKEKEAKRIEAEQRVKQQIEESREREAAIRAVLEKAGRQQSSGESVKGMNEYEAILEMQRKQAIQNRIDEGKRRQDELQRMMENAGRTEASEQTMDRYEEILQQQRNEEMRRQQAEAQRRQEALRRQLEEAGRPQEESASTMDQYSQWVEQTNKTSLARPEPWQPPRATVATETTALLKSDAIRTGSQPSSVFQPEQAPTIDSAAISPSQEENQSQQQQLENQQEVDPLVGKVLLDKFVVAEKLRVGGDRSELYKCYHVLDKPQEYALVIKLSHNIQQIELEHRIYGDLFSRLSHDRQELFVRAYDWVPASDLTNGRVGFAMECGLENLRGHIWRHGPYNGEKLRTAMENVIRIVQSLHGFGVVWSELKAENFIVFNGDKIKAVDLESVAAHNEFLRAYTAETYPPEFPAESLYQCLPQIPVDYSFDVWGMGLTLYELAVGEPLFTLQRTYDVEYIKERLKNPEGIVDEANKKMWKVESGARNIIRKCLVVDPTKRSSCDELLQDPYFANGKQPPAIFSPSAMGNNSFN